MKITNTFSMMISQLLNNFLVESKPDQRGLYRIAVRTNVLPLYVEMGGVYAINVDGDIFSFSWDNLDLPREETDPRIRNIVLFQGSKKYPELRDLIPERPDDAPICPHCHGTGIDSFSTLNNIEGIVCFCGGLGWIPKESGGIQVSNEGSEIERDL